MPIRYRQNENINTNNKELTPDKGRFINKQFEITTFDNNSSFEYLPIYRGISLIQTYYGELPDEDDYLENALVCIRQIGNVYTSLYGYTNYTDKNGELCLPIRAMQIEYVSDGNEDWQTFSFRNETSQLHAPGRFVSYKFLGDKIVTDFPEKLVSVAYRTYKQDEDGLPLITEREAEACAHWWKWVDTRRKLYKGNQLAGNILQLVQRDKNKAIQQARIPEAYSQNFMDKMLDVVYSQDRKMYGRSYKAVKT